MTLTDFLLVRIAEREAVARGSGVIAWLTYRRPDGSMDHTEVASATVDAPDVWVTNEGIATGFASAQVIYDERSVLAECEAKRQIVKDREAIDRSADGDEWSMGYSDANYLAVHALAVIYADHADYLPEWAVSVRA